MILTGLFCGFPSEIALYQDFTGLASRIRQSLCASPGSLQSYIIINRLLFVYYCRFGKQCLGQCQCENGARCDPEDGSCTCTSG